MQKAFIVGGGVAMAAAIVGAFLPLVPQVPFAIAAAYLFSKGSPRLHSWTRRNKFFGRPIRDWEDHGVVRRRLKVLSTLAMAGASAIGHWQLTSPWAWIFDGCLLVSCVFLLTRREHAPP